MATAIALVLVVAGLLVALRTLGGGSGGGTNAAAVGDVKRSDRPGAAASHAATPVPRPDAAASSTAAGRGSRTATPASTPRPASPAAATSAPPPPSGSACTHPQFVTSAPFGGWTDGNYFLYNNMWNASGYSVTQTLHACSFSNWYVVADMNNDSGNGAVKTYPNVQETFNEPAISSFHSITSSFAETSPHIGIYEDAYDIWLNGIGSSTSNEVMIWTENFHQAPSGSDEAAVTFGGRSFRAWRTSSGSYIAFVADTNFTSGTVNLLQVFDWLIAKGWIRSDSTLGQIDYGAEIVSTDNVPSTFSFTHFSIETS
jgi:hypothetical protein